MKEQLTGPSSARGRSLKIGQVTLTLATLTSATLAPGPTKACGRSGPQFALARTGANGDLEICAEQGAAREVRVDGDILVVVESLSPLDARPPNPGGPSAGRSMVGSAFHGQPIGE
jgi:hypothetical protein